MSSNSVRHRGGKQEKLVTSPPQSRDGKTNGAIEKTIESVPEPVKRDWDYKLALLVITALAFVTRFWGIGHPDEVVFDEVHFGKVSHSYLLACSRLMVLQCVLAMADPSFFTVRFILPSTNILFRCAPTLRQAFVRIDGLVRRL